MCVQVPEYLHHVARRLEEENDRIVSYLDQSTQYVCFSLTDKQYFVLLECIGFLMHFPTHGMYS